MLSVKYGWIIGSVFDVSGLQTFFMPLGRCSMTIALITSNICSTFCFLLQVSDDARGPQFLICRDKICLLDKDRPGVSENRRVIWYFIRRLKHAPFLINYSSAKHLISRHVWLISHINVTETPEHQIYGLQILIEPLGLGPSSFFHNFNRTRC